MGNGLFSSGLFHCGANGTWTGCTGIRDRLFYPVNPDHPCSKISAKVSRAVKPPRAVRDGIMKNKMSLVLKQFSRRVMLLSLIGAAGAEVSPSTQPNGSRVDRIRAAWQIFDASSRKTQDGLAELVSTQLPDFAQAAKSARDLEHSKRDRSSARLEYILVQSPQRLVFKNAGSNASVRAMSATLEIANYLLNNWTGTDEKALLADNPGYGETLNRMPDGKTMNEKIFRSDGFRQLLLENKKELDRADAVLLGDRLPTTAPVK
jgi:hypothetical protein